MAKLPRVMQSTVKAVLLNCLIQFMFNAETNGVLHIMYLDW